MRQGKIVGYNVSNVSFLDHILNGTAVTQIGVKGGFYTKF
jgi:hypothetical protein